MKRQRKMWWAALAALVAVPVALVVWLTVLDKDEPSARSGPETAVPTAPGTLAANAPPFDWADAIDLKPGMQSSIGYDTQVYYSPLGVGKGAPLSKVYRAYRGRDGVLRTEELLERHEEQFGGPLQSIAMDWERAQVVVAACVTGQCGFEGSTPAEGAKFRMFWSHDGGVTFELSGEMPPSDLFLLGFVGDEVLIFSGPRLGSGERGRTFLYPSMKDVAPPPGLGEAEPWPDGKGGLVWRNDDGVFDESGALLVPAGAYDVGLKLVNRGAVATWRTPGANEAYLGLLDRSGALVRTFRTHDLSFPTTSRLANDMLAATIRLDAPYGFGVDGGSEACKADNPIYPSLLNLQTGEVHPIHELGGCEAGHLGLHALIARPVVRVAAGETCVHLRAQPNDDAASLGCFAEGVLLPLGGDGGPYAAGWMNVQSPDLASAGYVSERLVER